jgi:peptide deformylase
MAILKVCRMGQPVLRQQAQPLSPEQIQSPALQRLIDDMIETMEDYEGIGLAAPQVFQSLRLLVMGYPDVDEDDPKTIPLRVLINPEWIECSAEQAEDWEGCLSIPDIRGMVPRSTTVGVRALDREGKSIELNISGLAARVLQHEVDHLDGILFLDRMKAKHTLTFLQEYQRYWQQPEE